MSGIESFNYPAFQAAAKDLRNAGYTVINPAENHGGRTDLPLAEYFKADLPQVCDADAVAVLPGWERSRGARLEVSLARHLEKPIYDHNMRPTNKPDETIAQEADRLVNGPRQAAYGHPSVDFTRTGRLWGAILGIADVPPATVGLMMTALKLSREVNRPKRDNRVDAIGYMLTVDMLQTTQA